MEIKILPTRKFFEKDIEYIKSKISSECEFLIPDNYSVDALKKYATEANVFLGGLISKELCAAASKLKFIQVPWTGVDNLNFKEIAEIGIPVCNSHSNASAVAEHAISMMLAAGKKISFHDAEMRKGNWNRPLPDGSNSISPFSKRIYGSNVAIVGYGHIGKLIHKMLVGFNCNFKIVDAADFSEKKDKRTTFYKPSSLNEVLPQSEFVFISVPLVESTKDMVNRDFFTEMKSSAILINISRGEVINENDLFNTLKTNTIAGAAIDTWYNYPKNALEPTLPSVVNRFEELENLVMSPHRSAMIEGELPHLDDAIDNLNRAAKGLKPINIISVKNKY